MVDRFNVSRVKTNYDNLAMIDTLTQNEWNIIDSLASEFVSVVSKHNLNYRQARILLEVIQVEIEECKLSY